MSEPAPTGRPATVPSFPQTGAYASRATEQQVDVRSEHLPRWISGLTLFSIVIIRLPLITGHATDTRLAILGAFGAGAGWTMSRRLPQRISRGAAAALTAYVVLSGIAMLRGAYLGVYSTHRAAILDWVVITVMALFALGLCASARTQADLDARLRLIAYAPAAYVGTNVLMRIFKNHLPFTVPHFVSVGEGGKDELASLLGIHSTRVNFPIAFGVYNFGAIAAAGFAAAVVIAMRSHATTRRVAIASAALCFYGVLATDTRGPLFFALAAILLFAVRRRVRASGGIALLLPFSPMIALSLLGFVAGSGYGNLLSRQSGDIATGNNRATIWHAVFKFLEHPNPSQLFGYGANGQTTSGLLNSYAYVFGYSPDPISYTTHNVALQTIVDSGYVGLVCLVVALVLCVRCLGRAIRVAPQSAAPAVLALVLTLALSGSVEAAPSYLFLDTFVLFTIALAAAAGSLPLAQTEASAVDAPRAINSALVE